MSTEPDRCPVCGRPVEGPGPVFRIRGLVLHLQCAAFRRRTIGDGAQRRVEESGFEQAGQRHGEPFTRNTNVP